MKFKKLAKNCDLLYNYIIYKLRGGDESMKTVSKIIIISFCIIIILSQNIFAISLGNMMDASDDFLQTGKQHTNTTMNTSLIKSASSGIYNILLSVATAVAVIVGAILGVQYMTAGIDKKVEVKESLFPYLISCVVVFGSMGIWKLVVTIMRDF